jgi:pilus assembly protein Flp/PilA
LIFIQQKTPCLTDQGEELRHETMEIAVKGTLARLRSMGDDRRGVTALEYGLIAAVMGALIVTAVTTLGGSLSTSFSTIGGVLTTKASGM